MADIARILSDVSVVFLADSPKAHRRMLEVYGTTNKHFALEERQAIIEFLLWAIHENFGLPDDLKLA